MVPSTAAITAAALAVSTVTTTTTKTIINTVEFTRDASYSATIAVVTARFKSFVAATPPTDTPRLLPEIVRLYANQTKTGGILPSCPVNKQLSTMAMGRLRHY
jgi:hypothetical protein